MNDVLQRFDSESFDLHADERNKVDHLIRIKGREIFANLDNDPGSVFNKDWWYGRIMDWSMKNEAFKTQMFRFVDVLPSLSSGSDVARHLKEYFAEGGEELPGVFNFGVGIGSLAPGLLAGAVRKNINEMARMFITGENPEDALTKLLKSRQKPLAFTVDLLGEATLSEKEAQEYISRYSELITHLQRESLKWNEVPQIDRDDRGQLPKVNVSVKLTALYSQIKVEAWQESKEILKERIRPLFRLAKEKFVFLNLDMEQYDYKDLTIEVFSEIIMEPEFKDYPHWGMVIQAYLRDSLSDVKRMVDLAKKRGTPFTIRLVKGAYWDFETIQSEQRGWPVPVFKNKKETDNNYEACTYLILKNHPHVRLALGSHNVRSIAAGLTFAKELGVPSEAIEVQMLYGMADAIKGALLKQHVRVREYATVGELIPGMAYLVRRLLENTSNESFLRSKFAENLDVEVLLDSPRSKMTKTEPMAPQKPHLFYNEPLLDFTVPEIRLSMLMATEDLKKKLGQTYPVVINDKTIKTDRTIDSKNPANPEQIVGRVSAATKAEAETAVKVAKEKFKTWRKVDASERADLLDKLAEKMNDDRFNMIALQVAEVGKTWKEADGDVAEAIDFCRYYARAMRKAAQPQRVGHAAGESSYYSYEPRGVTLVIAPWNFPLAILAGMVAAAAVAGNTVIMKPAEQSSVIAAQLMKYIQEAKWPSGVVSFLPGYGEEVGEYLVNHKDVSLIAFTGSKSVGLHILKQSTNLQPNQWHLKKCIIEMGGKNAIIIDSDADLDEAVAGVIYSAFGFSGQKCSACSRVIVADSMYDRFVERLTEAAKSITVGDPSNPKMYLGPVVDEEAHKRILQTIANAKKDFKVLYEGPVPSKGYFVPPTIFADVNPDSSLAQGEIFGPVLAVIRAKDIDHALEIANNVEYGLTGGVYSRSPANIEKIKRDYEAGNLYINRGITGALVNRHPFGGFKLSGIGSKTGGPDYIYQFMEPKTTTENTLRRGFAPEDTHEGT